MTAPSRDKRGRVFRTASLGAALALLMISLASVFAVYDWKRRHDIANQHPYDNAQWLVFQGAYETLKLNQLLDQHRAAIEPDELALRHEIFQSRVIALTTSAVARLLLSDPEAAAGIAELSAKAARVDGIVAAGLDTQGLARKALAREFDEIIGLYNGIAMRAIQMSARLRTQDLNALRASQSTVSDLLLVGLGCTVGLFAIVAVQFRRLRQERERAEAASRAKGAFLATMSHELRTPLAAVIGTLELLADDAVPPASRARITTARQSAEHLLAIIGDVLDMAKLEAGRVTLERVPFSMPALLGEVGELFATLAERKRIALSVTHDGSAAGWFEGDPVRLRQILVNLVSNALKFTESGGTVTVTITATAEAAGARLTIRVADNGVGIPAEAMARLGQRFEQADVSTTRRHGGTGLGIAIVRALAEAMSGSFQLESEEGRGTVATVTAVLQTSAPVPQEQPAASAPPAGLRVLLAEDNPVNQATATALLHRLGVTVDLAQDGEEAVARAAEQRYDLILMDVEMPHVDGLEATRRIRSGAGPSASARIVAVSANAFTEAVDASRAAGMDGYIAKPMRKATLSALLASLGTEQWRKAA